jgi:hypothetical protein
MQNTLDPPFGGPRVFPLVVFRRSAYLLITKRSV